MFIRLIPVCDCGYLFREGITFHEEIEETEKFLIARTIIDPYRCPSCGELIEGISCDIPCRILPKKVQA